MHANANHGFNKGKPSSPTKKHSSVYDRLINNVTLNTKKTCANPNPNPNLRKKLALLLVVTVFVVVHCCCGVGKGLKYALDALAIGMVGAPELAAGRPAEFADMMPEVGYGRIPEAGCGRPVLPGGTAVPPKGKPVLP